MTGAFPSMVTGGPMALRADGGLSGMNGYPAYGPGMMGQMKETAKIGQN